MTPATAPRSGRPAPQPPRSARRRRHPFLRVWAGLLLLCVAVLATLVALTWVSTPPVDDATARADRIALTNGGTPLQPDQIPPTLATALVDTEDAGFWDQPGVSPRGMLRAAVYDLQNGCRCQGGSTIEQQLADNLYTPSSGKAFLPYWQDTVLAVKLARTFSKKQILSAYLTEVYLGHYTYGAVMAARVYFGAPLDQLTLTQYAMLAGLPQAPSLYDPLENPGLARQRLREVLDAMVDNGDLTPQQAAAAAVAPL